MARKDSDHQKKSMNKLFRGRAIFKPLNTGHIDEHVACVREWVANIFFYTKNGTTIMVDAGYNYARLQEKMGWLDIDPASIRHILVTHQDTDHVGALETDSEQLFRDATVYIGEIENRYLVLSLIMMAGLFLMLWGAVGFVQDKRFFSSAPKEALDVIQTKEERFKGQHAVGWVMLVLSLVLMGGAVIYGGCDGIRNGFSLWQFFARFAAMLLLLKAFDILFFDWYLLCRSNFFPRYYPEVKAVYGPHLFGYNKKSHMVQTALIVVCSFAAALICTLLA